MEEAYNTLPVGPLKTRSIQCSTREQGEQHKESLRKTQWDRHSAVVYNEYMVCFYRLHRVKKKYIHQCTIIIDQCHFQVYAKKTIAEEQPIYS